MRIIEDSLDLKTVPYGYKDDDNNPTIAEVTYDDPKLKAMEEFEANKRWKRLEKPGDGSWPNRTQDGKDSSPVRRTRHDSPSPPRKGKGDLGTQRKARHDSDSPPLRKGKNESLSPKRNKNDSSPVRRGRHDSESPPRKFRHDIDSPRRPTHDSDSTPQRKTRSDSDDSPPRRKTRHDSDSSPTLGRHDSDSSGRHDSPSRRNSSPPRRARQESVSPPRRTRHDSRTPPWRVRHESDSPRPNIHKTGTPSKLTRTYSVSSDDGGYTPPYPPPGRPRKDSDSSLSDGEKKNINPSAPPQRPNRHDSSASPSPPARRKRYDSDASPPRRHDSDASPPRRHDSDLSLKGRKFSSNTTAKRNKSSNNRNVSSDSDSSTSDSSDSPLTKVKKNGKEAKLPLKRKQQTSVKGGVSSARTTDRSPKRKQFKGDKDSDSSPPRRKRHDSDVSPPRKKRFNSDSSPPPKRYDSDASPPRQKRHDSDSPPLRRKRHDSDSSPVRKKRGSDSDASPPRIKKGKPGFSPPPKRKGEAPGEGGQMRPERKMTTQEYLLARKKGRLKKDTPEDIARKEREAALQQQAEEKHQQWKHGVKQVQDYKRKAASDAHEMGKAFTRTADDADMNAHLKMAARKEDPMLEYLVKKDTKGSKMPVKPVYKGSFPPNRLDIRPGYRWDGVDRSSGFEKRWFEHQNNKRAHNEDAYKWSVSDM